jgi:hypothetical protein
MKAQHDFGSAWLILATGERETLVEAGFDPQYSIRPVVYGTTAGPLCRPLQSRPASK